MITLPEYLQAHKAQRDAQAVQNHHAHGQPPHGQSLPEQQGVSTHD
jgi:hypothetical protein